jgi:uncharacterized protein YebE (UPF0316 family)
LETLLWIEIFLLGLSIDVFYTLWVLAVSNGRRVLAGLFSVLLYIPSLLGLLNIIDDHILAIPFCLGLFFGTILGISLGSRFSDGSKTTQEED